MFNFNISPKYGVDMITYYNYYEALRIKTHSCQLERCLSLSGQIIWFSLSKIIIVLKFNEIFSSISGISSIRILQISFGVIQFRYSIMVQYVKEKTNPGTTRETKNYEIIFVAGHQHNGSSYVVEYESNWIQLMKLILASLEFSENTFDDISLFLNRELQKYLNPCINVRLDIFDQTYFPMKKTKSLHLSFTDPSKTSLVFLIRRKQVLRRKFSV